MPRNSRSDPISSESENDDAPESISLLQSKRDTQRLEISRRIADVILRNAKREKNREMDRKLKERAAMNEREKRSVGTINNGGNEKKKKSQQVNDDELDEEESEQSRELDELEKRMQRAMKEAGEEAELESDEEGFAGIIRDKGAAQEEGDDDETTMRHPDHLPDELFAAAFSSSSKRTKMGDDSALIPPAKKRKASSEKEDIIVGSRAIRILPNSSAPSIPSTTPSRKNNKFIDRALSLKHPKQNLYTKGWERRPVNIGVLKRDGAPVSFVRNKDLMLNR